MVALQSSCICSSNSNSSSTITKAEHVHTTNRVTPYINALELVHAQACWIEYVAKCRQQALRKKQKQERKHVQQLEQSVYLFLSVSIAAPGHQIEAYSALVTANHMML